MKVNQISQELYLAGGRALRLRFSDVRALRQLVRIVSAHERQDAADPTWLIPLRPEIRDIVRRRPVEPLLYVAAHSNSNTEMSLAIWLCGLCGGTYGTKTIAGFYSADPQVRKVIVRSLARLHAWSELRDRAQHDPDPTIRDLALRRSQGGKRRYLQRLQAFLAQAPNRETPPPARPMWVADGLEIGMGCPPKSRSFLRALLENIRRLVRGYRTS